MKRDTIVVILAVIVIVAAMVAFVWWRSTKTLMSSEYPDRAMASSLADGTATAPFLLGYFAHDLGVGSR